MSARLYCTFLLLYLQEIRGQHVTGNNQNVGVNNPIALQQHSMQRMNSPNMNQHQNGININVPQQPNYQQGNLQPINFQGNLQQASNPQGNFPQHGGSMPISFQIIRQLQPEIGLTNSKTGAASQLSQGVANLSPTNVPTFQQNNGGINPNFQGSTQNTRQMANIPTYSMPQTSNIPSLYPFNEISAINNQPSLLSLIGPQNMQPQQNQQAFVQNQIPQQNQLTDYQKQMLVKSLQTQQPMNIQNQFGFAPSQNQQRFIPDNQQFIPVQGQPVPLMPPIVTQMGNQPAYIPVQGQPLTTFLQNQGFNSMDEEQALLNLILSEFRPSSPQYAIASAFAMPKKGSKSSLKTLIPLIINLLKERNSCGCRNCGCQNNRCSNLVEEPTIFSGYSKQKNYSEGSQESLDEDNDNKEIEDMNYVKGRTNVENNVVNVDSSEASEETDSEYVDDEEA